MIEALIRRFSCLILASLVLCLSACGGEKPGVDISSAAASGASSNELGEFSVKYIGGEDALGTVPKPRRADKDETIAVAQSSLEREGYDFVAWNDGEKNIEPGAFYAVTKDTTFTAVWEKASGNLIIGKMENTKGGWQGFPTLALGKTTQPVEGKGYFEATSSGDIVFVLTGVYLDASKHAEKGKMHISIYLSDHSALTGGQIELSSGGTADKNELTFGELGVAISLKAGWNDLAIPISSGRETGGKIDISAINFVRIYFNIEGKSTTVGIDNFYLSLE